MNKNVKFWLSLKVNDRLTWRREQHNQGWESGGKGAQKYGRRENVVQEAGDSDPPVTPHRKVNDICNLQKYGRQENVVREAGYSDPVPLTEKWITSATYSKGRGAG